MGDPDRNQVQDSPARSGGSNGNFGNGQGSTNDNAPQSSSKVSIQGAMPVLQSLLVHREVTEWATQALNRASTSNELETVTQFIAAGILSVIVANYEANPILFGQEGNKAWSSLSAKEAINVIQTMNNRSSQMSSQGGITLKKKNHILHVRSGK